jgi:hypothetical protein
VFNYLKNIWCFIGEITWLWVYWSS